MNPLETPELREQMIDELNIAHLTQEEQNTIITQLSEVLMQRAMLDLVNTLSEEDMQQAEVFTQSGDNTQLFDYLESKIPNAKDIVMKAFREGLEDHKRRVNEIAERDGLVQESAAVATPVASAQVASAAGAGVGAMAGGVPAPQAPAMDMPSTLSSDTVQAVPNALESLTEENPIIAGAKDTAPVVEGLGSLQDAVASVPQMESIDTEPTLADALQTAAQSTPPVYAAEDAGLPDIISKDSPIGEDAPDSILDTLRAEVAQKKAPAASAAPTLITSDAVQAQTPLEQHFAVGENGEAEELGGGAIPQTTL